MAKDTAIPLQDIADNYPGDWCRYFRGFKDIRQMAVKQATTKFRHVKVIVLSGETGVGKTRAAIEYGGYMIHADDMSWWDGYQGEETLIIDEYASKTPITQLLGLLDGYQKRLPIKGGFTYANWIKVIITTNQTCLHEKSADDDDNSQFIKKFHFYVRLGRRPKSLYDAGNPKKFQYYFFIHTDSIVVDNPFFSLDSVLRYTDS